MTWAMIGSAAISAVGGAIAGDQAKQGQKSATRSTRFSPWGVNTGLGGVSFDRRTGQATSQLSPEYQALRDKILGQAGQAFGAYQNYDPYAAANALYGQLNQMAAPGEQQARTSLENRLFAQGRLGAAGPMGYNPDQAALYTSQNLADLARQNQAFSQAQSVQNQLLQRAQGLLGGATGLDQSVAGLFGTGADLGRLQSAAAELAAKMKYKNALNQSDATSSLFSNLASGLKF